MAGYQFLEIRPPRNSYHQNYYVFMYLLYVSLIRDPSGDPVPLMYICLCIHLFQCIYIYIYIYVFLKNYTTWMVWVWAQQKPENNAPHTMLECLKHWKIFCRKTLFWLMNQNHGHFAYCSSAFPKLQMDGRIKITRDSKIRWFFRFEAFKELNTFAQVVIFQNPSIFQNKTWPHGFVSRQWLRQMSHW